MDPSLTAKELIPDTVETMGENGSFALVHHGETIAELAEAMGVDAASLEATVERYNELAAKGVDEDFGKPAKDLLPLSKPPYFGGILLGAGGLVRAYTQSAKDALDAAGISVVRRWVEVAVPCPYSFFERLKLELEAHGGVLGEVEYAADVTVHALLPEERAEAFSARLTELAAGGVAAQVCGESFQAVPRTQV